MAQQAERALGKGKVALASQAWPFPVVGSWWGVQERLIWLVSKTSIGS